MFLRNLMKKRRMSTELINNQTDFLRIIYSGPTWPGIMGVFGSAVALFVSIGQYNAVQTTTSVDSIRKELKENIKEFKDEMRLDIKDFKIEMKTDIKEFKDEVKSDIKVFKDEIKNDLKEIKELLIKK
jgi:gas vesicle protein